MQPPRLTRARWLGKGTTEQTITLAKRDHPGPSRRWRVAFGVAIGKDEFDETHLTLRGVAVEGRNDWEHGGRSIYFRDPDEHLLELATPGLVECIRCSAATQQFLNVAMETGRLAHYFCIREKVERPPHRRLAKTTLTHQGF